MISYPSSIINHNHQSLSLTIIINHSDQPSVSSGVTRPTSPELKSLRPQSGVHCDLFVILPQLIPDAPPTRELAYVACL